MKAFLIFGNVDYKRCIRSKRKWGIYTFCLIDLLQKTKWPIFAPFETLTRTSERPLL